MQYLAQTLPRNTLWNLRVLSALLKSDGWTVFFPKNKMAYVKL